MTIASHSCKILLVTMFSLAATYAVAQAADARRQAVMSHVRALETSVQQPLADVLAAFDASHFSAGFIGRTEAGKRRALLAAVRESVASAQGILLDEDAAGVHLRLMAPDGPVRVTLRVAATAPFRIEQLTIGPDDTPVPELAWESLTAHFDARAADGWSGVVYAVRDGEVVVDGAWGKADRARGTAVTQDTVFGIGSVPIDFTVAAVLLLDQRGRLQLDDPIHRHLGGVPEDKRGMTIRHLIEGRSGLPDFHDRPGDWDADLAWIDRETAVRRILEQPLRFAPGEGEAHSHSAYGLAAAIVERVSGQSYGSFLADEFFVPAGMTRTGFYGETGELELDDFAVGHCPSSVGLPNIPPNGAKARSTAWRGPSCSTAACAR